MAAESGVSWDALDDILATPPAAASNSIARERLNLALTNSIREMRAAREWLLKFDPDKYHLQAKGVGMIEHSAAEIMSAKNLALASAYQAAELNIVQCAYVCAEAGAEWVKQMDELNRHHVITFLAEVVWDIIVRLGPRDCTAIALDKVRVEILKTWTHARGPHYTQTQHAQDVFHLFFLAEARAIQLDLIDPNKKTYIGRCKAVIYYHDIRNKAALRTLLMKYKPSNELGSGYSRMSRRAVRRYQL